MLLTVACVVLASSVHAVTAPTVAITGNLSTLFGTAAASQRVVYQYGLIQSVGGSIVPGGSACSTFTDASGNLPTSGDCTSFVQGSCAFVTIGSGHPVEIQFPYSTTADLSTLILANLDPPVLISDIVVAGPYAAGVVVTNPALGQIGTATITWPTCNSVTDSSSTYSLDTSAGLCSAITLGASSTITPVNMVNGQQQTVYTIQNSTGGFTPTFAAPGGYTLTWVGGFGSTQPGFPTLNANTILKWEFTLNGTVMYGRLAALLQPPTLTVAQLPTAATRNKGQLSFITDSVNACSSGQPLVGGGSTGCPVISDGSSWNIVGVTAAAGSSTVNFNNYSITNVGNLQLVQQSAPSSLTVTATCSGTCATTYTYEVTCVTDTGESDGYTATGTNASALSSTKFNVLTWATQDGCTGGYNVYGRTGGALGLLSSIAVGTTTYTDTGSAAAAPSHTFTFNGAALPAVATWDFSGQLASSSGQTPIDVHNNNSGTGTTATATGLTTAVNNETVVSIFGFGNNAGTTTAPAGLSHTVDINPASGANFGLTGGSQNKASSGAVTATTSVATISKPWAGINIAITPANTGTPLTFVNTLTSTTSSPYTSITFADATSAAAGDIAVSCVSYLSTTKITKAPPEFIPVDNGSTNTGGVKLACYYYLPTGSGAAPPTVNTTGIITQSTANGIYRETLLGLQTWTANTMNTTGQGGAAQGSITWPVPMTVISCRATWLAYTCTNFPVFAMKDTTAGVVLCSSGTVTNAATDGAITPSSYTLPKNDVLKFLATTTSADCSAGATSMTILLHE